MSPVKRPSAVSSLRRAATTPPAEVAPPAPPAPRERAQKPARVTLNLPPQLYRDLVRWADTTAEALDVPRVGVQEALRAMVREVTSNPAVAAKVMHQVREELDS